MIENDFSQKLIDKIKSEKLAPVPRWRFLLKGYVIWVSGALALLFGALGVSVIIYLLKYNDWEMSYKAGSSLAEFFLLTLPYFWLLFLGLFIFILYYNLKHTKRGYRYPIPFIISAAFLASIILGEAFFLLGLGEDIDEVLGSRAPFYREVFNPQIDFWFQPEQGRLAGIILPVALAPFSISSGSVYLLDPAGESWKVLVAQEGIPSDFLLPGQPLNIVGEVTATGVFEAKFIKPARPGRAFMGRQHPDIRNACHDNCFPPR
jgi:hypothetical protein